MAQLTKDTATSSWKHTISSAGTDVLETQGKFVDRNITVVTPKAIGKITMKAGSGSVSAGSNCTLSTNNTSGIAVTGSGSVTVETAVTTPGFLDSMTPFIQNEDSIENSSNSTKYITSITMSNGKKITINDGIYSWTLQKDSNGNVSIF